MPVSGLSGLAGINAIEEDAPFATAEQRMGGTADPRHAQIGEKARPYPWESSQAMGGSHGPYGQENGLLSDEVWFMESGGSGMEDPQYDYVMPDITRSHGSPHHVTISGAVPSQYDAIAQQLPQSEESHAISTGLSKKSQHNLDAVQDHWAEIWNVDEGSSIQVPIPNQIAGSSGGWGNTDRVQSMARQNEYGFDSHHKHRRYAVGSIPGNYMWMKPGGRPMYKSLPGPARPAIGEGSPFAGDDLGASFAYDTGAVLQNVPTTYAPPPNPYTAPIQGSNVNPNGTDGFDMW